MSNTTMTDYDHKGAIREVCASGWTRCYPDWVREAFTKALLTDGPLPTYAAAHVNKALRVAGKINERNERDAEVIADKRQASRPRPITSNKADKKARDRAIRQQMKGSNPSPAKYGSKK